MQSCESWLTDAAAKGWDCIGHELSLPTRSATCDTGAVAAWVEVNTDR